ncbi:L-serine ammonia-lyase, iron-sulfur-dependent subunit beta [Proteiniborus sp. MB09-C3]|uniref:L-serine ammonia-lyase, iron-sulfur-dependent subunit beta n=1 Tax=Proteiniborus sp. MB09-C3 TaxID=3050072 RepID=UPI002554BE4E|nr:L-serine ammonia-lyase, iron-sulfur-dependent subunit beta [Proteiniborus sp. MB09-C3]WIV13836.1 L-serine ammonia-lyase, iron-sulfur-dependent subunit beta [Proteiniborus sp. MB09-C3]
MREYSVFDILGPIMIGPSSSHTAGAARIGKVARYIAGDDFSSVDFYLHGSFAKTYKGHGTDKALVAGILGMEPYDEDLKNSLKIAEEKGIKVSFLEADLGIQHENTVKIVFNNNDGSKTEITGSSIGGGNILITNVDGYNVKMTGDHPTLIVVQNDKKGIISRVTTVLSQNDINIGIMKVKRKKKGVEAYMIIETDDEVSEDVVNQLKNTENVLEVKVINPVKKG